MLLFIERVYVCFHLPARPIRYLHPINCTWTTTDKILFGRPYKFARLFHPGTEVSSLAFTVAPGDGKIAKLQKYRDNPRSRFCCITYINVCVTVIV